MVAAGLIEAGDEMRTAGPGRAAAHADPSGQLGLASGGKRSAFLMANADPFNVAAADGVGERIERVADQSENVPDTDLLQSFHQYVGHSVCHRCLTLTRSAFPERLKLASEKIVLGQI